MGVMGRGRVFKRVLLPLFPSLPCVPTHLLGGGVQALGHAPVLRAALPDEDDRHAVVALGALWVEVAVEEDGAGGAHSVGQLLRHESPPALEVLRGVVNVHGPARALARPLHLFWRGWGWLWVVLWLHTHAHTK